MVLARRAALPGRPGTIRKKPKTFHTSKKFTPLDLKTYPFCSWNFLSSLTKFSCSWRYTAGSLFNIFAILRLCHFHITFTAFSGKMKAICRSRGSEHPELQSTRCSAAWLWLCGTHRSRGGWLGSAPRTSTSSLVRGCPTDASGKARQSTGQYGTSTHPQLRSEIMKYFSGNFQWGRTRESDSMMPFTF